MDIQSLVNRQRSFFKTDQTKDVTHRIQALTRLKAAIINHNDAIIKALNKDLGKSETEAFMAEIGMVLSELTYIRKNLKSWVKPVKKRTPLSQFHSKSYIVNDPYGVVLIMVPWNYPFMLAMEPLIGAIAGGNCCILKLSEEAPAIRAVIKNIIEETFDSQYVSVTEGSIDENDFLLEERYDYIFFTGGISIGRLVLTKAARYLTPVTLELGGKSPCIVDSGINIDLAAKRIVFGKFLNCGQTCVAPDYILIVKDVKEEFVQAAKKWIHVFYGDNPVDNKDYPKMINKRHYDRVMSLLKDGKVVEGGDGNESILKIAPTLLDDVSLDSQLMEEEIFGPLLPLITIERVEDAVPIILSKEKPLALYLFTSSNQTCRAMLKQVSFGGGCINDTVTHLVTSNMGFGGVGYSGMGSYHGKDSFTTFTHPKSILKKSNWIDLPLRYPPFSEKKLSFIKLFLK